MTAKSYCRLAALIFAVVAALQLIRAVNGWPITVGATTRYGQVGSSALLLGCLPGLDLTHLDKRVTRCILANAALLVPA